MGAPPRFRNFQLAALDLTGGNVRAVQRFSRHRDLRVLNLYDDNRQDLGGEVAALVAGAA